MCVCVFVGDMGSILKVLDTLSDLRNRRSVGKLDNSHLCKQCWAHFIIGHVLLTSQKDVDYTNHPNTDSIPVGQSGPSRLAVSSGSGSIVGVSGRQARPAPHMRQVGRNMRLEGWTCGY